MPVAVGAGDGVGAGVGVGVGVGAGAGVLFTTLLVGAATTCPALTVTLPLQTTVVVPLTNLGVALTAKVPVLE